MKKLEAFTKKNSSIILGICSGVGLVCTTVLAVTATPKAIELINKKKQEENRELTVIETVKTAWKPYIPTGISMFSTFICIFGNSYLNKKMQTSLLSAYAILDKSYKEYVNKTKELYGENADINVKKEIANSKIDSNYICKEDKKLFFEFQTMTYFESTMENLIKAENSLNEELAATGYATMGDFFKFLNLDIGIPEYADSIGWCDHGDYHEIKFKHEKMSLEGGISCILIDMDVWTPDYAL